MIERPTWKEWKYKVEETNAIPILSEEQEWAAKDAFHFQDAYIEQLEEVIREFAANEFNREYLVEKHKELLARLNKEK